MTPRRAVSPLTAPDQPAGSDQSKRVWLEREAARTGTPRSRRRGGAPPPGLAGGAGAGGGGGGLGGGANPRQEAAAPPAGLAGGAEDEGGVRGHGRRVNAASVDVAIGEAPDRLCVRLTWRRGRVRRHDPRGAGAGLAVRQLDPDPALVPALRG